MSDRKLIRLSKTGIEHGDWAWNWLSGCKHKDQGKCPPVPCWAAEFVKRFPKVYPDGFAPHIYLEAFREGESVGLDAARRLAEKHLGGVRYSLSRAKPRDRHKGLFER
jgi:hypothetical protein